MANTIIPFINDFAEAPSELATPKFVGIEENPAEGQQHIPIVYGARQVEGIRLWTFVPGGNTNLLYVIYALSEGWCGGVDKVFIDDQNLNTGTLQHRLPVTVASGPFAGILDLEFIDGRFGTDQFATGPVFSALLLRDLQQSKGYSRLSYLVCRFTYNDPSPYRNIPKVTVAMRGRILANLTNPSLAYAYKTNPVEILWDLLSNRTYGARAVIAQQDSTSFDAAKNACDVTLTSRGGATVSTFTANWICDTSNTLAENISYLLTSYKMTLTFIQGKYFVTLESSPSDSDGSGGGLTFNTDNIVSDISIQFPNLSNKYNQVTVDYPDKDTNFQIRSQTWPVATPNPYLVEDGNIVLETRFSADTITDYWHASDFAQMFLLKSRGQKIYRFTADKTAHRLRPGDFIFINTALPLIANQKVIVLNMTMNDDYTFELECADSAPGFYPPGFVNTPVAPPAGTQQVPGGGGSVTVPTPVPSPDPAPILVPSRTFSLSTNGTIFNEGASVIFTLTTTGVTNGTVFDFTLGGGSQLTAADISPSDLSGTFTVNSNTSTYSLNIVADAATEGSESFTMQVFDRTNGQLLTNCTIAVQDTSLSQPPALLNKVYSSALFLSRLNTNNQLENETTFYITQLSPTGLFDITEHLNNNTGTVPTFVGQPYPESLFSYVNKGVRQRVQKFTDAATGITYCTLDMDISLIDRTTAGDSVQKNIFCVYDNWTAYRAGRGLPLKTNSRSLNRQVLQFDYETPPSGTFALKATKLSDSLTSLTSPGWERIDNTSATAPIANTNPGIVRLPYANRPGHYSTNLSNTTSGRYTIQFPIDMSTNRTDFSRSPSVFVGPMSVTTTTQFVRLHFFQVLPNTNTIVPIGQKIIGVGLNKDCITAKYYAASRINLTSVIGSANNSMPAA